VESIAAALRKDYSVGITRAEDRSRLVEDIHRAQTRAARVNLETGSEYIQRLTDERQRRVAVEQMCNHVGALAKAATGKPLNMRHAWGDYDFRVGRHFGEKDVRQLGDCFPPPSPFQADPMKEKCLPVQYDCDFDLLLRSVTVKARLTMRAVIELVRVEGCGSKAAAAPRLLDFCSTFQTALQAVVYVQDTLDGH
jgi:hypothetical protein